MAFERPWHRHYAPGVPAEVAIDPVTMPALLERTAARHPQHPAFIYFGRRITFAALLDQVHRFARALAELGVGQGDKVSMILPNIPQVVIANHAAHRLGAVTAMHNPLYTERELTQQIADAGSRVAVVLDLLLPRIERIRPQTALETVVTCGIRDFLPFPQKQFFPLVRRQMYRRIKPGPGLYRFEDLIARHPAVALPVAARWEDPAALLFTGGTTGVSKGAVLTHANISGVVQQFTAWFPDLKPTEESIMGIYPIFHSAGYSVSQNLPIANAWTCVLVPRPEPSVIIDLLAKYRPTFLPGVPTIFVGLLNDPRFAGMDLSFVKGYFAGAAPLAPDTVARLETLHGATIHDVYGATEDTAFATCAPYKGRIKPGTAGLPLPNTDIRIVDAETGDRVLAAGEVGEICIRGPQVMQGYYRRPEETAAALRDGWFYLGDLGFLDEEGYLTVVDRKKDMIVAGGYNIYPTEVDAILMEHPGIMEACTFGVPDAYRGETVKCCVVPMAGSQLEEDEVIAFCRKRLAAYKVPRQVVVVPELPKSAVGKILRREVRRMDQQAAQDQDTGGR